jgi:hypothetical protein
VSGRYDDTASTGPNAVLDSIVGTEVAIIYGPEGDSNGDVKVTCQAICTAYNRTSPVGDVVAFSCEFQITGDVTETTYSS